MFKQKESIVITEEMKAFAKSFSIIRAYGCLPDAGSRALYASALVAIDALCNSTSNDNSALDEAAVKLNAIINPQNSTTGKYFDIVLYSRNVGNKIRIISAIRQKTFIGLKEAKDLVDKAPSVVFSMLNQEQANALKAEMHSLGVILDIVPHGFLWAGNAIPHKPLSSREYRPSTLVKQVRIKMMLVVGESTEEAYRRLCILFRTPALCYEFLQEASAIVDEMPWVLSNGEKLAVECDIFAHPICGQMIDVHFLRSDIHFGRKNIAIQSCPQHAKIPLIKELRSVFGGVGSTDNFQNVAHLGLKEAKDIVDTVPCQLILGVSFRLAQKIKQQLEDAWTTSGSASFYPAPVPEEKISVVCIPSKSGDFPITSA